MWCHKWSEKINIESQSKLVNFDVRLYQLSRSNPLSSWTLLLCPGCKFKDARTVHWDVLGAGEGVVIPWPGCGLGCVFPTTISLSLMAKHTLFLKGFLGLVVSINKYKYMWISCKGAIYFYPKKRNHNVGNLTNQLADQHLHLLCSDYFSYSMEL